jgi:hypothetical protein
VILFLGRTVSARLLRVAVAVALGCAAAPAAAAADVLFTPFWGVTFGGSTTLIDLEQASGSATSVLGGSVMVLGDGVFGVEGDFGYSPRFFEKDNRLVASSSVTTVGANLVVTLPRAITRDSLRPYALAGGSWMHASSTDKTGTDFLSVDADLAATTFGGGAVGMLRPDIGVRFDLRYLRGFAGTRNILTDESERLSFWRFSLGVVFRY